MSHQTNSTSNKELSAKGAAFLRAHEGFVPRWYKDPVGVLTIGIGFTWNSTSFRKWWKRNKPGLEPGQGRMTRAEADDAVRYLCRHEYGKAVNLFYGSKVPQHVFDSTTSPVYNIGERCLKWKWAATAKRGDYAEAARRLKTAAVTAKGKRLPGLVRRRSEEALLLSKGIYTGIGKAEEAEPVDAMADGMLVRGERGPAVRKLIKKLTKLGFYDGIQDDVFGFGTEAAVIAFQEAKGLKPDGWAGPETLTAIDAAIAAHQDVVEREIKVPVDKPVVPDTVDDQVRKKTGLWGWLTSILGGGGAGLAGLFGMEWQTIIAIGGVTLGALVVILLLRKQIAGAIRDIRAEIGEAG